MVSKKKKFYLNLNQYRNTHFTVLNNAKIAFSNIVIKRVQALPSYDVIKLTYTLFPKTRALCDVANVCSIVDKFFSDVMTHCGRIQDDNYLFLPEVTYRFGEIDKENPRVEVLIESFNTTMTQITETPKEPDPMRTTLNDQEIKLAIAEFVQNRFKGTINEAVEMIVTSDENGLSATMELTPNAMEGNVAAPLAQSVESVVQTSAPTPNPVKAEKADTKPTSSPKAEPKKQEAKPTVKSLFGNQKNKAEISESNDAAKAENAAANISAGDDVEREDPKQVEAEAPETVAEEVTETSGATAQQPYAEDDNEQEVDPEAVMQQEEAKAEQPRPSIFGFGKK
jgi:hypothetical protein